MSRFASRLLVAVAASALAGLVLAEAAFAPAGGGSSGFGGGGGGGGGGGAGAGGAFSGGSGSGRSGGGSLIGALLIVALFALVGLVALVSTLRYRRRRRKRLRRVELASAEAAEDDPAFAAQVVVPAAAELHKQVQRAWDRRDRSRLAELVGEDLFVEWSRRLDDFDAKGWHNRVRLVNAPEVSYVGLVNRERDHEDRAVVEIKAMLEDYVVDRGGHTITRNGSTSKTSYTLELWTLAKREGRWIVAAIEQHAEGRHHYESEIVATPWSDSRVADEAVIETASEDPLPEGFAPADLADLEFDGEARAAALDLSVADPRFAPDVLEAAARRAVGAWAQAVDGSDAALVTLASRDAVGELLYRGDASRQTRLVVRGPRVRSIRIAALDAGSAPPTMTVDVELGGVRYVEDRDTAAVLSGSRGRATTFSERWTLALDGPDQRPWRLVQAAGPRTPA